MIFLIAAMSCSPQQRPKKPVQMYLMMLTGELNYSESLFETITTENYRSSEHPHLLSLTPEQRENAVDLVTELKDDPVIQQVFELVAWETTYEIDERSETEARVVARVVMVERRPGDRESALEIPNLPEPFREVLESDPELPFQFELIMENGAWKINEFEFPEELEPLLDLRGIAVEE